MEETGVVKAKETSSGQGGEAPTVYWHLPGLCSYFNLNQILIVLMQRHPDKFRDGYRIGSVYGTFPGAIWNGGRSSGRSSRSR